MTPRVLFVARSDYHLPLDEGLARKWDALSERLDLRVLASGTGVDPRFALRAPSPLDGALFYASLPARIARELRTFRPDVVIAQSPYEGFAAELARRAARSPAKVIVEVHGDRVADERGRVGGDRAVRVGVADREAGDAVAERPEEDPRP